ncbi:MAG: AMP-binding protein, partial [Chloroflexi bacterium]|nr:AMP-binding protein [Chloroflexota bacterium]
MALNPRVVDSFQPETLVELLRWRAQRQPDNLAYTFLVDGETEEISLTYAELDQRARSIAAWLQRKSAVGERVLLLYPSGLDYIAAFFGCLYAGVVAVPAYPPRLNRPSARIQGIVADAEATVALTTTQILDNLERRFEHAPDLAALRWLDTEEIPAGLEAEWREPTVIPETLAFLQYTSGSTSAPKGVMLSHGNLIHNLAVIRHGFQIDTASQGVLGVFWLPSYHDMGLIGGILEPMYVGGSSLLMSPAAFLQRPARWLEAITRYQGAISGAPNFAYQLCVEKITPEQRAGLDLSSWHTAFCGAEPIRPSTLVQFAEAFVPCGFNPRAFYPCYGLAEGSLLVSGGDGPAEPTIYTIRASALGQNRATPAGETEQDAQKMVSCGHALLDQQIVIANPETMSRCAAGEVGEIWMAGPSVAQGYWGRPEQTAATFQAYLADSGEGPFLRTGDLGFLHEGELYVTGRLKDLIIIRGRNHYPQDLELAAEQSHEALEPHMGAAFSVEVNGEERLVIVHEVTRRHRKVDVREVAAAVRQALAEQHEIQLYALTLIKPLSIPKTSSGKIKRHACKLCFLDGTLEIIGQWRLDEPKEAAPQPAQTGETLEKLIIGGQSKIQNQKSKIESWLVEQLATRVNLSPAGIDIRQPFAAYGLDSVQAVSLAGELESWLGRSLPPTLAWDYPTIAELAAHLAGDETPTETDSRQPAGRHVSTHEPIAVIGLGCRFPGAPDPDAFWQLLHDGVDAIREVPPDRWDVDAFYAAKDGVRGKMNTRWGGFLDQIDHFDPRFFGIAPREASRMDPQQRLLLEVAWEALENAGLIPGDLAESATGVFVGISSYDYSRLQFSDPGQIDAYAGTGNAHSIAANRLSYLLDLRGPSLAVDTACSSSLVAMHLAIQSLRNGESDLALAGGVNLLLAPELTITFSQARMMAADGRCKTFDARADGYVRGEGCGLVVLKRLSDALHDGDNVLAVLRGSAVNQDGRSNGLTAPNGPAQQAVIRQALADAEADPAAISYIEAHGTGTPLGDPIEIQSLRAVLEDGRPDGQSCLVGSVKTNVGHLEAAAGVAGLIKVVLALQHGEIPPHLHFRELNPYISLDGSPLAIATGRCAWPAGATPRLAGVSSFGFGGTNAHIVVSDFQPQAGGGRPAPGLERPLHLLALSARSDQALQALARRYERYLAEANRPELALADVCFTANTGRTYFDHRLALAAGSAEALQERLAAFLAAPRPGVTPKDRRVAFLFTGQGSQYTGMSRRLYETQPTFRAALDRCAEILQPYLERPLLSALFEAGTTSLDQTIYTQPALFALEYALAELWRSWGVEPAVLMGHSVGEYVAACQAGVFSLEDGLKLIAARGRLMQTLPPGGEMAAVFAGQDQVAAAIVSYAGQLSIAAVNGPENVVVAGEAAAVRAVLAGLAADGVEARPLTVSHAFHSPLMEPMLDEFEAVAREIAFRPPQRPLISNLTGRLWAAGETPDAAYWRAHVRQPVHFAAGMEALFAEGLAIFLEIGPQPHLLGLGRRCLPAGQAAGTMLWLPSLREKQDDWAVLLESLAALYTAGVAVDWTGFDRDYIRRKVTLPTYPFERERYWLEVAPGHHAGPGRAGLSARQPEAPADLHPLLGQRLRAAVPIFEARFDPAGLVDLPTTFGEMALAAAFELFGPGPHRLEGVTVAEMRLESGPVTWQTLLALDGDQAMTFQIFAWKAGAEAWQLQASGRVWRGAVAGTMIERQPEVEPAGTTGLTGRPEIEAFLRQRAAQVLGLPPAQVGLDQPLDALGLDSLMAIELRNALENSLGVTLPVVNFLQGPTITALVGQLLELLAAPQTAGPAIRPVAAGGLAPLSYGQQAMWFLHQLLPEDVSFNVAGAVRLHGRLDVAALRRAWQRLVERHAALRTTFHVVAGQPVQQVRPDLAAPLDEVDATTWDETALRHFLEGEAYRSFDL